MTLIRITAISLARNEHGDLKNFRLFEWSLPGERKCREVEKGEPKSALFESNDAGGEKPAAGIAGRL